MESDSRRGTYASSMLDGTARADSVSASVALSSETALFESASVSRVLSRLEGGPESLCATPLRA